MKTSELQKAVKLLSKVSNQGSISELFRCTEIGPNSLRTVSEYANIELWLDTPIPTPQLINTNAFAAVITSLPTESDIELALLPDRVAWSSGSAKGHWGLIVLNQTIPVIPSDKKFTWTPPKDFPEAIELAGSACVSMTVSVGLYGVILEPLQSMLRMTSSNTISLATTSVILDGYPLKEIITLRPPVPNLLAAFLRNEPTAKCDIGKDGIFILSKNWVAHLPLSVPLEHDLPTVIARFEKSEHVIKISSKAISQFLNRAKALMDKNIPSEITMQITEGKLLLEQKSVASSSEEYFLADGVDSTKSFKSVVLPLNLMVTSLSSIQEAVLDFLDGNILILRGSNPEFRQIIGGKAKV